MADDPPETRPGITSLSSGAELLRWYWLKTELVTLARHVGVSPGGDKRTLTARLAAHLDGQPTPEGHFSPDAAASSDRGASTGPASASSPRGGTTEPSPRGSSGTTARRAAKPQQLTGPLTADTVIPPGQRSSQSLRAFFVEAIGPGFRFDGPMRAFNSGSDGDGTTDRTLGDAVAHWHATRNRPPSEIAPQFELNRFVRAWHAANPSGTHAQALEAWRAHRALPAERRN